MPEQTPDTPRDLNALITDLRGWVADGPFDSGARLANEAADALAALRARPAPDREAVASVLKAVRMKWSGPAMQEFTSDPRARKDFAQADAVLALLAVQES